MQTDGEKQTSSYLTTRHFTIRREISAKNFPSFLFSQMSVSDYKRTKLQERLHLDSDGSSTSSVTAESKNLSANLSASDVSTDSNTNAAPASNDDIFRRIQSANNPQRRSRSNTTGSGVPHPSVSSRTMPLPISSHSAATPSLEDMRASFHKKKQSLPGERKVSRVSSLSRTSQPTESSDDNEVITVKDSTPPSGNTKPKQHLLSQGVTSPILSHSKVKPVQTTSNNSSISSRVGTSPPSVDQIFPHKIADPKGASVVPSHPDIAFNALSSSFEDNPQLVNETKSDRQIEDYQTSEGGDEFEDEERNGSHHVCVLMLLQKHFHQQRLWIQSQMRQRSLFSRR
jgi:hypothetical protein